MLSTFIKDELTAIHTVFHYKIHVKYKSFLNYWYEISIHHRESFKQLHVHTKINEYDKHVWWGYCWCDVTAICIHPNIEDKYLGS